MSDAPASRKLFVISIVVAMIICGFLAFYITKEKTVVGRWQAQDVFLTIKQDGTGNWKSPRIEARWGMEQLNFVWNTTGDQLMLGTRMYRYELVDRGNTLNLYNETDVLVGLYHRKGLW